MGEGFAEVAPLPGLHREQLVEAECQLALMCKLLIGRSVPPSLGMLQVTYMTPYVQHDDNEKSSLAHEIRRMRQLHCDWY